MTEPPADPAFHWFVALRRQEYEGESRANLLRICAIAAFYAVELVNYRGLDLPGLHMPRVAGVDWSFHLAMTVLAGAWALTGWAVLVLLRARVFPGLLKFASTACDLAYLTAILLIADGPRSPLAVAYFPLLALAGLRFDLALVRFATIGAGLGYAVLLMHSAWLRPATLVPRYFAVTFILALGFTGIWLGQIIRRTRALAHDFASRLDRP
ncbi:MAG: hypothetical protein NTY77_16420 [Elusimicrobia bacterium]|nr:hypothetical protein [Elusimicrobiota bacterium]